MLSSTDSVCLQASFSTEQKPNEESKHRTELLLANLILLGRILLCDHGPSGSPLLRTPIHKVQRALNVGQNQDSIYNVTCCCGTRSSLPPVSSVDTLNLRTRKAEVKA